MIALAADVHGPVHFNRFINNPILKTLNSSDYLIICGDFGIVWDPPTSIQALREWVEHQKFLTLFLDGNHEYFPIINQFPITRWCGGKIHQISQKLIHLMRGQVFQLEEMKFFTFGGAFSLKRITGNSPIQMWPEEMPNYQEYNEGLGNLKENNFSVDYVLTHTAPSKWLQEIGESPNEFEQELNDYLDHIEDKLTYKHWYFGHFHQDWKTNNYSIFYEKMSCLGRD